MSERSAGGSVAAIVAVVAFACGGAERSQEERPALSEPVVAEAETPAGPAPELSRVGPEIRRLRLTPEGPLPGESVSAEVVVKSGGGQPVELGYTWHVAGRRIAGGEPTLVVPMGARKGDRVRVRVTPSDGRTIGESVVAEVMVPNRPPEWQSLRLEPSPTVAPASRVVAVPEATDVDGDPLEFEYTWYVNDRRRDATGESFDVTGLRRGDALRVTVVVSDSEEEAPPRESDVVRVGNAEPRIVSAPETTFEDGVFRYALGVEDPDGDTNFRYGLVAGPDGMEIDAVLGEISWRPDPSQVGTHGVELAASDGHGGEARQVFELTVNEIVSGSEAPAAPAAVESEP
ncbi:MAG: hypothetical protein O7E50_00840 [Gemmatimonadetes bacterium]|nr:hypothetical protein [Gemmatimonadota bacterium]